MKLTDPQRRFLRKLYMGEWPWPGGRSANGGASATLSALRRRGLVDVVNGQLNITEAGKQAVSVKTSAPATLRASICDRREQ